MIVLDASALVELVADTEAGRRVARRWTRAGTGHAPHLATAEALHVIRRLVLADAVGAARGAQMVERLAALPFVRHGHDVLLWRAWELRSDLTSYDATYVALAEALGAPLLTLDARLAGSPGHRATIELVAA